MNHHAPQARFEPDLEPLEVLLAKPRGFCAGVIRAVEIVERALEIHGAPVYVRHEIVHNTHVVEQLRARGAIFVSEVDEIPEGAVTVFSAHGVSRTVESMAADRSLDVIDAIKGVRTGNKGFHQDVPVDDVILEKATIVE